MKNAIKLLLMLLAILAIYYAISKGANENVNTTTPVDISLPIELSKHAKCRMDCRNIDMEEIDEILQLGKINHEKSRSDHRGQTFAFEGRTHDHQEVRIIVAPKSDKNVIVTVIDLENEWACDCP